MFYLNTFRSLPPSYMYSNNIIKLYGVNFITDIGTLAVVITK